MKIYIRANGSDRGRNRKRVTASSTRKFYGLPDVEVLFLNTWEDPRLIYNGYSYDVYDVTDTMVEDYDEWCDENGIDDPNRNEFYDWAYDNRDMIYEILGELERCGAGKPYRKLSDSELYNGLTEMMKRR